jgi:diguanylate cyclase (GGDEF)-like protein
MKRIIKQKTLELNIKNIELKKLASTDSLTKVYNRRMGFELLNKLIILAKRNNKHLVIGFIDIDNLKYINDKYGHSVGDRIIKLISEIIKKHIRESDIIARYGGDEFFIGLYDCNIENAKRIENSIKRELIVINKIEKLPISVSIGFVEYENNKSLDEIISKADKIMYQNKIKKKH